MADPRDTHGHRHPPPPHRGQRPAQAPGEGGEPAGLSGILTRREPGQEGKGGGKDEHRRSLQLTGLRAPERPRTYPRHGSAHRLAVRRREVSELSPSQPQPHRPPKAPSRPPEERARSGRALFPPLLCAGGRFLHRREFGGRAEVRGRRREPRARADGGTRLSSQRGEGAGGAGRRGAPLLGKHHSDPRQAVGRLRQQAPAGIWR